MGAFTRWWKARSGRSNAGACRACGHCCDLYGGQLLSCRGDVERWRATGRDDLLALVGRLGWLWVDPATGRRLEKCPFLVRAGPNSATCGIHDTKPEMCRAYPTLWHERRCARGVVFGWGALRASVPGPGRREDLPEQYPPASPVDEPCRRGCEKG